MRRIRGQFSQCARKTEAVTTRDSFVAVSKKVSLQILTLSAGLGESSIRVGEELIAIGVLGLGMLRSSFVGDVIKRVVCRSFPI